jgi:penicillin-binding protein 1C
MTKRFIVRSASAVVVVAAAVLIWLRAGPLPSGLLDESVNTSTTVVDRRGTVLYEARSRDGTRGSVLTADALPPNLVRASLAAEDHRFFSHVGIDPIAITRAAFRNLKAGEVIEGGSTISQQVAKLLLARRKPSGDGARRGLVAKLREATIALRLEHRLSKHEILALYLNLAPYGNQITGAERAGRVYFGTAASQLTVAQAAFLAGLPQRPSAFNPYRKWRAAVTRQQFIINRMAALGQVTTVEAAEARAERLSLTREEQVFLAPHVVEMVLAGDAARPTRIETTIDAELQSDVEGIIRSQRSGLVAHRAHNVAVVVLHNATGEWLAWEGSGDYLDTTHGGTINGPLAPRQPGSALKPFTYALAFEEGRNPATVLPDVPSHFSTAEPGVLYSPRNYDGQYRGPLLVRKALAGSQNVPAVALASELGIPKLVRFFRSAGLTTFDKTADYYGLGVTLGNAEVRLAELTSAYSIFARGGLQLSPVIVREKRGLTPFFARFGALGRKKGSEPLISPRTAFWITDILADPAAREHVFGRGGSLDFPFQVAVKTGTSEGYRDNWAIGYTREVTVGVWVGNFDRTPLANSSGVTGAGPIFHAVMLSAQRRVAGHLLESTVPLAAPPAGVVQRQVCALSGLLANAWCPAKAAEWMPSEGSGLPCSWHHESEAGLQTIWPEKYRQWAVSQGFRTDVERRRASLESESSRRPQHAGEDRRATRERRLSIASPPDGALYLIDPTLRPEFQRLSFRAAAGREGEYIDWAVNGQPLGRSRLDGALSWALVPGEHRITARDAHGRSAETRIRVR